MSGVDGNKKVPAIRFEGFSGEWEIKKIENLISDETIYPPQDGNHGEIHPKAKDYVDFGIPFIMANSVRNGSIDLYGCSHITIEQAENLQKGFAKKNDVLLTHKGTVGEVAIVYENEFPFIMLTPQVTYYRILDNKLDNQFLASSFSTKKFQHSLKEAAGGGTRAYIGITQQQELSISISPQKKEQTKIGNYFQQLDTLIAQHQQKHDKLQNLKKALLEKCFPKQGEHTPELRFKGFSGAWEEKALGDVANFNPKAELPQSFEYVDLESVSGTELISYRTENKRSAPSRAQRLATKGDVFYQTVRPYQKNNYLFNRKESNFVFSTGYAQMRPYGNSYFLLSLVQTENFVRIVLDNCTGTSYPAINSNDLAKIDKHFP